MNADDIIGAYIRNDRVRAEDIRRWAKDEQYRVRYKVIVPTMAIVMFVGLMTYAVICQQFPDADGTYTMLLPLAVLVVVSALFGAVCMHMYLYAKVIEITERYNE